MGKTMKVTLWQLIVQYLKDMLDEKRNERALRLFKKANPGMVSEGEHVYWLNFVKMKGGKEEKTMPCQWIFANPEDALLHRQATVDENDVWDYVGTAVLISPVELDVTNYRAKLDDDEYQELLQASRDDEKAPRVWVDVETKKMAQYHYEHD